MKYILFFILSFCLGFMISKICADLTIKWLGCPVYTDIDSYGNGVTNAFDSSREIGLRSDGVVVWRDKKQ